MKTPQILIQTGSRRV